MIRCRRGLSLDVTAGLASISKPYLSALELGQRGFNRRGLLEDLAAALGCSVADVTGQPYLPTDRNTADALASLSTIRLVLNDFGPMDVPELTPRRSEELASLADRASEHCGQANYSLAGWTWRSHCASPQSWTPSSGSARLPSRRHRRHCMLPGPHQPAGFTPPARPIASIPTL